MSGLAGAIVPSVSGSRLPKAVFLADGCSAELGPRIVGITLAKTSSSSLAIALFLRNALKVSSENLDGESDGRGWASFDGRLFKSGSSEEYNGSMLQSVRCWSKFRLYAVDFFDLVEVDVGC